MLEIIIIVLVAMMPILLSVIAYFFSRNNLSERIKDNITNETKDDVVSISDEKEILLNAFQSRKIAGETVKLVLERYRLGDSEIRNAPQEAEYIAGEIIRALNRIDSNNINEVSSGLFTLGALGTSNLLNSLREEISDIQDKWIGNAKIMRMVEITESNMQSRLDEPMQIRFVEDNDRLIESDSIVEIQY